MAAEWCSQLEQNHSYTHQSWSIIYFQVRCCFRSAGWSHQSCCFHTHSFNFRGQNSSSLFRNQTMEAATSGRSLLSACDSDSRELAGFEMNLRRKQEASRWKWRRGFCCGTDWASETQRDNSRQPLFRTQNFWVHVEWFQHRGTSTQ